MSRDPKASPRAPRAVVVLAVSLFGLSAGEELWQAYVPAFLSALGASGAIVGLFASTKDLLDSLYQYPGGWLVDRIGRRNALLGFTGCATAGYAVYVLAPGWPIVFVGLVAVMAWKAAAFPLTFSIVGESLPAERRATAFAIQSVLVRLPRVVCAPIGGVIITTLGIVSGFRVACAVTIIVALMVFGAQYVAFDRRQYSLEPLVVLDRGRRSRVSLAPELRRLLLADALVRIGEGIAASFIVLFVTQARQLSIAQYGMLYAIQQAVAIAAYVPGAHLANRTGPRRAVAITFLFFAAFPIAVRNAGTAIALVGAFILGGLKEVGEPARKALIVELSPEVRRASAVGVYYALRNLVVVPAGLAGGLLWQQAPQLPLELGSAVSLAGLVIFLASGGARSAQRHPQGP